MRGPRRSTIQAFGPSLTKGPAQDRVVLHKWGGLEWYSPVEPNVMLHVLSNPSSASGSTWWPGIESSKLADREARRHSYEIRSGPRNDGERLRFDPHLRESVQARLCVGVLARQSGANVSA